MILGNSIWQKSALTAMSAFLLLSANSAMASEASIPDYMKVVTVGDSAPETKSQVAFDNIYALNEAMFPIYEQALATYQRNFRAKQNLIMALFSAKGGRFILYRAGQEPIEAPSPPPVYRIAKSVGHCAMVTFDMLAPHCADASADQSWVGEAAAYRTRVQTALGALDTAELKPEERELMRTVLNKILALLDKCLANKTYTFEEIHAYAQDVKPDLAKLVTLGASTQVNHWYKVMEEWKKLLGKDWDNTYGLSNTIYVARQNNVLFSVLVQFMGEKAINDRLLLLETTDFTTTPDAMLTSLMRIISDRALGKAFFNDYKLMDYELMGGEGRKAIEAEAAKRGQKAILPPLVPFNSNEWPWKIDPKSGSGATLMEEIH